MALSDAAILERVRVEGKDAINRFNTERVNMLRDTCREICTTQNYSWLKEIVNHTLPATPGDWVNIDEPHHQVAAIAYTGTVGGETRKRYFEFVDEDNYFTENLQLTDHNRIGYYRLRWDEDNVRWQFALIGGPASGTVEVLQKKIFTASPSFPEFMEEALVQGTLWRFLKFLEGDDLDSALIAKEQYEMLVKQHKAFGDDYISQQPQRVRTIKELYDAQNVNVYRSNET